jgi:hypothetical protein
MLKENESILRLYCIGIVVNDKEVDSDVIDVYPVEELPLAEGNIKEAKIEYDETLPNSKTVPTQGKIEGKLHVQAKWVPFGHSNRITAPDVYANEHVVLFRYADTGEYYWTTIYREPMFRRLETVCYMYSDLKEKMKEFTKESSYWCEVSTREKYIHIHTSDSDGEEYKYDIIINTKESFVVITDNVRNYIRLTSPKDEIQLRANNLICLNAPTITQGTGCAEYDDVYHYKPFVRTDEEQEYARIGNEYRSYSHYDKDFLFTHTNDYIEEETVDKTTNAAKTINENTIDKTTVSTATINEKTTDKTVVADASITEETTDRRLRASASITEETVDKTIAIENKLDLTTRTYEHKSENEVHIESLSDDITIQTKRHNNINLNGNLMINGQSFDSIIANLKAEIATKD